MEVFSTIIGSFESTLVEPYIPSTSPGRRWTTTPGFCSKLHELRPQVLQQHERGVERGF